MTVAGVKESIRLYCSPVSMCCKQWPASWKSVSTSCKTIDTVTMAASGGQLHFSDLALSAYAQHMAHAPGVTKLGTRISNDDITRVEKLTLKVMSEGLSPTGGVWLQTMWPTGRRTLWPAGARSLDWPATSSIHAPPRFSALPYLVV